MTRTDVIAALAAENPLSDRDAFRLDLHLAEMELLEDVVAVPIAPRRGRARTRRAFWRPSGIRRGLLTTTAVAGLVAVAVILLWPGDRGDGPSSAAAAVLTRLSQIAASGPSLVPGPGQYLAVRSVNRYTSISVAEDSTQCVSAAVDHRAIWIAGDGSGLLRESRGKASFPIAADRAHCRAMPQAQFAASGPSNTWFAARCFGLGPGGDLQSLSTDPRVLLGQMRRIDGGPGTPAEDLVHVGDFLRETDASPKLRAALYRAAALIPGVRSLGVVRDHVGRKGLGVALTIGGGERNELIFNRHTAALMGEQGTGSAPGDNYWAVYLSSRVVDRQPYPSPVPLRPACHNGGGYSHTVAGGTAITGQTVR